MEAIFTSTCMGDRRVIGMLKEDAKFQNLLMWTFI